MLLHFLSQETFQNSHESGSVDKACKKSLIRLLTNIQFSIMVHSISDAGHSKLLS